MAKSIFHHVKLSGITAVVPEKCINIDDEVAFFNNDVKLLERNKKILGLGTRHVAEEGTAVSDLMEAAARNLMDAMHIAADSVEALIAVSSSHDFHYPATACVLQGRLGLPETCATYDVGGLACSAYVNGLWQAHALIESGAVKNVLVLAGDITSTHSDRRNRNSNMLFGDAATATFLEYSESPRTACFDIGTRGTGWNKLIAPAGGYYLPIHGDIADKEIVDENGNVWRLYDDIMKGLDVFKFATDVGPKGIESVLSMAGKTKDDIEYYAFHQANKQIVRSIAGYSVLPRGKWSAETFSTYGNCGATAVALDVCRALNAQPIKDMCLATFGVGLAWGFAVLDTSGIFVDPIANYTAPTAPLTREQKIEHWINYFKAGNDGQ